MNTNIKPFHFRFDTIFLIQILEVIESFGKLVVAHLYRNKGKSKYHDNIVLSTRFNFLDSVSTILLSVFEYWIFLIWFVSENIENLCIDC